MDEAAAALPVGHRIGVFQVSGFLGAGGMGEVYRARDTRLGRDVAIKILPRTLTSDADRRARFEREARLLAALSHPHVAAIHGVEEADGRQALVLELVEGETLADALRRGPLPASEAYQVARQVAEALEAAHEKGIVHRDLKPANIKITPTGVVKVLDFGLAKEVAARAASADLSHSPTMSFGPTGDGVLLGTAPYMSPEQARGRSVDERTDVWAFGCVLYEMLTGHAAFAGPTVSDTIAGILEREPAWDRLPKAAPSNVRRLLRRCLQKDMRRRLRHIGDAHLELDEPDTATTQEEAAARHAETRGRRPLAWLAGAVALGALALWGYRTRSTPNPGFLADAPEPLTFDSGLTSAPALAGDGRMLAYATDRAGRGDLDIWVQQMAGGVPLRLTDDSADDYDPDFSPDGDQIAFRSDRGSGGVYIVPTLGGTPRLVAPEGREPRFSPDGKRVAFWAGAARGYPEQLATAVYVVSLAGGTPVRLLEDFAMAQSAVWAPDGRSLLVLGRRDRTTPLAEAFDWWRVSLDGAAPVRTGLLDLRGFRASARGGTVEVGSWMGSGALVSERASLWLIPLSPATGRVAGPGRQLALGTGAYRKPALSKGRIVFSVSRNERVIERAALSERERNGEPVRLHADELGVAGFGRASVTKDGSTIVFERVSPGHVEIWRKDLRSGAQRRVLSLDGEDIVGSFVNASVSPDGTRVGYTVAGDTNAVLEGTAYVVEIDAGVPQRICDGCGFYSFLSDNRRAIVGEGGKSIGVLDIRSGGRQDVIVDRQSRIDRASPSPDDRWIAFRRASGGGGKVLVAPIHAGSAAPENAWRQIDEPTTTGRPCGWSPDSRVLYLLLDADGFRCLWGQRIDPESGQPIGVPYAVRHFHRAGLSFGTSLGNAIVADGFVYEGVATTGNIWGASLEASSERP